MVGGALSGTVGTQQGLAAAGGAAPSAGAGVFGPGVIGEHCWPALGRSWDGVERLLGERWS